MALTRDEILAAEDRQVEEVSAPEWGGIVRVQAISAMDRDRYEQRVSGMKDWGGIRATLCVQCIVDDEGNRIFTDDDIEALSQKSGAVIDRVFEVARRLNGMTDEDIQEMEKNSETEPTDVSISS